MAKEQVVFSLVLQYFAGLQSAHQEALGCADFFNPKSNP
jgi:hypothetical protein